MFPAVLTAPPVFPAVLTAPPVLQERGEWPVGGPLDAGGRSCPGTASHFTQLSFYTFVQWAYNYNH